MLLIYEAFMKNGVNQQFLNAQKEGFYGHACRVNYFQEYLPTNFMELSLISIFLFTYWYATTLNAFNLNFQN